MQKLKASVIFCLLVRFLINSVPFIKHQFIQVSGYSAKYICLSLSGNLPFNVTADDVKNHFSCAGKRCLTVCKLFVVVGACLC